MVKALLVHASCNTKEINFTQPASGYAEFTEIDTSTWIKFKNISHDLPEAYDYYPKSAPSKEYVLYKGTIYKKPDN